MADEEACILHPAAPQPGEAIKGNMHTLIRGSSTTAVYRAQGGGQIRLKGRGFQFERGIAVGGTVTGAIFEDEKGEPYLAWGA